MKSQCRLAGFLERTDKLGGSCRPPSGVARVCETRFGAMKRETVASSRPYVLESERAPRYKKIVPQTWPSKTSTEDGSSIAMKTIVLKIRNFDSHAGNYPVEMRVDDGSPTWFSDSQNVIRSSLPADLGGFDPTPPESADGTRDLYPVGPPGGQQPDGQRLYDLLIRGSLAMEWERLRRLFPGESPGTEGRRIVLEIEPDRLRRFPWEIIGRAPIWLARDAGNSLVRGPINFSNNDPPRDGWLRVLVVVGSKSLELAVNAEAELGALERTFWTLRHRLDYRILMQPSKLDILNTFKTFKPNVFHFIGHGERLAGGDSCLLLFDNAKGNSDRWMASDIYTDLNKRGGPARWGNPATPVLSFPVISEFQAEYPHILSFVFLNACHTTASTAYQGVWSLADTFIDLGANAVLGMHGAVHGESAALLSSSLYEALANGGPLDLALTEARSKVSAQVGALAQDWQLPYLCLRVPPEKVLAANGGVRVVAADRLLRIESARDFQNNPAFVDRHDQRDELLGRLARGASRASDLLVVGDVKQIGKTQLIWYCLEACALWGFPVKYVNVTGGPSKLDYVGVLRAIRDGESDSLIAGPLPSQSFVAFNRMINAVCEGKDPRDPVVLSQSAPVDQRQPLRPGDPAVLALISTLNRGGGNAGNDRDPGLATLYELISTSFLDALSQAATTLRGPHDWPPAIVVLDQITKPDSQIETLPDDLMSHLSRHLLKRVRLAEGAGRGSRSGSHGRRIEGARPQGTRPNPSDDQAPSLPQARIQGTIERVLPAPEIRSPVLGDCCPVLR